ncbi:hypothetical protein FOA52_005725 [Chlamydomonas sp. UWO 241]|nr:hypothetical protein FOA52_005725 [Chlamydomonas sp. UWO 241]
MLEIVCAASEFDTVPLRPGEEDTVERLLKHAVVAAPARVKYTDPHTKVNALLQAHFSRTPLAGDLVLDVRTIVPEAVRLLQACVDVIASSGWLSPALVAMEMSQMVSQGCWDKDSPLLQLPHVTKDLAKRCGDTGVGSVFELLDLEDDRRRELLNLPESQLADVAAVCARYPDIQLTYESTSSGGSVLPGEAMQLLVSLEREMDEDQKELSPVPAARFPGRRDEAWWLVVGDPKVTELLWLRG